MEFIEANLQYHDPVEQGYNDHVETKEFDRFIRVTSLTVLRQNRGKYIVIELVDRRIRVSAISGDRYERVPLYWHRMQQFGDHEIGNVL